MIKKNYPPANDSGMTPAPEAGNAEPRSSTEPITVNNPPDVPRDLPPRGRSPGRPRRLFLDSVEGTDDEDAQLQELLKSETIGDGYIVLYRRKLTDTKHNYLDRIPTGNFNLETIKNVYGGGDYMGKIFRSDGQFFKNISFSIDASIPSTHPRAAAVAAGQGGDRAASNLSDEALRLLAASRGENAGQQQAQGRSDMAIFASMITAMMKSQMDLMVAMLTSQRDGGGANTEILKALIQSHRGTSPKELIESMAMLKDLQEGKPIAKDEEGGFGEVIADVGAALLKKFTAPSAGADLRRRNPPAPQLSAPAPAPTLPAAPNPETAPDMNLNPMKALIVRYRDSALAAARENKDPARMGFQHARSRARILSRTDLQPGQRREVVYPSLWRPAAGDSLQTLAGENARGDPRRIQRTDGGFSRCRSRSRQHRLSRREWTAAQETGRRKFELTWRRARPKAVGHAVRLDSTRRRRTRHAIGLAAAHVVEKPLRAPAGHPFGGPAYRRQYARPRPGRACAAALCVGATLPGLCLRPVQCGTRGDAGSHALPGRNERRGVRRLR